MKIRLVNCNLLIAFFGNNSFALIVTYLFSVRHESRVWQRPSIKFAIICKQKSTFEIPKKILLHKI